MSCEETQKKDSARSLIDFAKKFSLDREAAQSNSKIEEFNGTNAASAEFFKGSWVSQGFLGVREHLSPCWVNLDLHQLGPASYWPNIDPWDISGSGRGVEFGRTLLTQCSHLSIPSPPYSSHHLPHSTNPPLSQPLQGLAWGSHQAVFSSIVAFATSGKQVTLLEPVFWQH